MQKHSALADTMVLVLLLAICSGACKASHACWNPLDEDENCKREAAHHVDSSACNNLAQGKASIF